MSVKTIGGVRYELDPDDLPTMSDERLAALRAMTDDEIDLRDTPSQAGKPGRRVGGPRFGVPPIVVVLDADVLQFFHDKGDTSSTRVNAALREYVAAQRKTA